MGSPFWSKIKSGNILGPPLKKFKWVASLGKVTASVFWDCEGVLIVNFLQKSQTINRFYYALQLCQLKEAI